MYLKTGNKTECCGCTACQLICSKGAITMIADNEGFKYPQIDKDKCIECGLCEKVCPFATPQYNNNNSPQVYAGYAKSDVRQQSSSGGIFSIIANHIIEQGGIVYGAAFDENLILRHIGVETIDDLCKLRGSKYLQSDLRDTYKEIRKHLQSERWVYFVGTGCQVAGLKSFLRKDYHTLITSDIVCHGVPSQQLFNQHIKYLEEKKNDKIVSYSFRDVKGWRTNENIRYSKDNKLYSQKHYALSPYLYAFEISYTLRYSCYSCKFARIPRQGDITLADFWGAKYFIKKIDTSKGVSMIIINNKKGEKILDIISTNIELFSSNIECASIYNNGVIKSKVMPPIRNEIYKLIEKEGYETIAKKFFRPKNYRSLKFKVWAANTRLYKHIKPIIKLIHK